MKTTVQRAIRDEKGQVLIMVLILLVVGGLILTPLLGLMSTGLLAGKVYEKKMDELYAADAGVEDAIWKITHNESISYPYYYPKPLTINGKIVDVVINRTDMDPQCGVTYMYQILSIAATDDGGGTAAIDSSTTIDAHIVTTPQYYPSIMDHLITIQDDIVNDKQLEDDLGKLNITCPQKCKESGNCGVCGQPYDYYTEYDNIPEECRGCVAVYNFPSVAWPTAYNLSSTYWQDVENATPYYTSQSLDIQDYPTGVGPLFWNRTGTVQIENGGSDGLTLGLNGTVYTIGDTIIGQSGPNEFTVDLNGHTIFASSTSSNKTGSNALVIGGKCTVQGPGLIIAVGDIKFAPKAVIGGADEPIFVLSVDGTATAQPSGKWWGAIAGKENVEVKKGNAPVTMYPEGGFGDLAFPRILAGWIYSIASWEINP